ncbi:hypothetical protein GCM10007301_19730 [Azorhizobium oxalatiphilum]|uniref:Phospholipase D-like domain-containing protein n=1 Tax=Azorhizobium oxalatiphilum TaxID=980631 RepID=A0A917BYT0_9HYPH|nr:hypothetical protein [Azorhizobium oxalatiphilum]GGF60051.1 hypothetical protein GCM10007301_19730 [Azorhizobium oxalatiphilum]
MPISPQPLFNTEFVSKFGVDPGREKPRINNIENTDARIDVYFRDLKTEIINRIEKYPVVAGCVAWLTDFDIIRAMRGKNVSIIMQKEDMFRPDIGGDSTGFKKRLRRAYSEVGAGFSYALLPETSTLGSLWKGYGHHSGFYSDHDCRVDDDRFDPFRCVGNYNRDKSPAFARMHNKFLVFCEEEMDCDYKPVEVWTGSYNMSKSASLSFENGLSIRSTAIASAYLHEYADIAALSEPLDWKYEWVAPEFGIGVS